MTLIGCRSSKLIPDVICEVWLRIFNFTQSIS